MVRKMAAGRYTRIARAAVFCAALLALPAAARAKGVTVTSGVVYGEAPVGLPQPGQAKLLMDLYRPRPAGISRRPAVVVIHGGGFVQGKRTDFGVVRTARSLAERGIVAASIDYRLQGQAPVPAARMARMKTALGSREFGPGNARAGAVTAATEDALSALRYLRSNAARFGIRTSRFGVVGSSAGAVIADNIGYVVSNYGVASPRLRFVASLWGGLIVPSPGGRPPAENLRRGDPALFLVHGDGDDVVPVRLSDEMDARARKEGVPVEYHRIAGGGHGWNGSGLFKRPTVEGQVIFERMLDYAATRLR